jgi:hypothetical protein
VYKSVPIVQREEGYEDDKDDEDDEEKNQE